MGKVIQALFMLAYIGVNFLIGGYVDKILNHPNWDVMVAAKTPLALAIGFGLLLLERFLPKTVRAAQFFVSVALTVALAYVGVNEGKAFAMLFGAVYAAIKLYAGTLLLRKLRGEPTPISYPRTSGKEFYNSQAWRKLRYSILNQQGRCCVSCGENRVKDDSGKMISYHVDHIKPRSKYPHLALDPKNMQVMCEACNLGKSNHWDIDHREERGIA